jgi:hypothetical protein
MVAVLSTIIQRLCRRRIDDVLEALADDTGTG